MKLKLSEGRVYGARYYTVEPEITWDLNGDWGNIHSWETMNEWCTKTLGATTENGVHTPGARWYANNSKFWFRTEADQILFVLRWT